MIHVDSIGFACELMDMRAGTHEIDLLCPSLTHTLLKEPRVGSEIARASRKHQSSGLNERFMATISP